MYDHHPGNSEGSLYAKDKEEGKKRFTNCRITQNYLKFPPSTESKSSLQYVSSSFVSFSLMF